MTELAQPEDKKKRKGVLGFFADIRTGYAERKKNAPPNDKKYRPAPIWYFDPQRPIY